MSKQKLTMTCREAYYIMREAGISCSPERVAAGIASGLYPFGTVINVGETGRRTILIYTVDFYEWLESKIPGNQRGPLNLVGRTG